MPSDALPAWVTGIYSYVWFVGFFVSGIGYTLMMRSIKSIEYVTAD